MEILSDNDYELVKNLSVINSDIENYINKRVVETLNFDANINLSFKNLIDAGFLKKKDNHSPFVRRTEKILHKLSRK